MRPMTIEVDERNASDVAELVASSESKMSGAVEKLREKAALRSRVMNT